MRVSDLFESLEQNMADEIRKNCTRAVALLNRGYFFNHFGALPLPIGQMETHNQRKPKDTSPEQQKWFDEKLTELGFKAQRHNSLFVNPRLIKYFIPQQIAAGAPVKYGSGLKQTHERMQFWIMPEDSANITHNPNVGDLFGEHREDWEKLSKGYTSDWFSITHDREVMISGKFYYISLLEDNFMVAAKIMRALHET